MFLPGDKVTYTRVRGSCRLNKREVTFTDGGECVVRATLARSGYLDWDSGEKIIVVSPGTLSGISWAPTLIGTVGVRLVLEEVVGVLPGDKVTYTRVRGSCRLNKREVTFTDGGECVVKATLARSGYLDWDSGEKIIVVSPGTLSGISWAPSLIGTVGVRLVLEEITGAKASDKVTYTRVRGSCRLNKREVVFTDGGECVVKATLARSGYLDWDSGEKIIVVSPGTLSGISWAPSLIGTVGVRLVLEEITGAKASDKVTYTRVRGSCRLNKREVTFTDGGECVVKATLARSGYLDWDSGEKIIAVGLGTLSGVSWAPSLIGTVGVPLVLEEVVGVLPGDKVTYTRVRGSCRLNKREVTFTDGGECVVKATLARSGYLDWDSGEKIIAVGLGTLSGISWAPSLIGTVGVRLVLEEVVGVLPGDKVTYTRVRGSCRLNKREVTFTDGGECVVKATLARSGYLDWDSGEKIIAVGLGTLSGISWAPSLIGTVGVPLVLEEVVGVLPGDKVTYTRVRGSCRLNKREVTFTDGGECVVKATLARSGFFSPESQSK